MILPSETRFVDEIVKESFYKLEKGDSSEKELFRFVKKYGVANLWKYDLLNAWRLY